MAPKTMVVSTTKDADVGLADFTFMYAGKKYKVTPKNGDYDKLDAFFRFIKGPCEKQGVNPFTYRNKESLNIERVGGDPKTPPKPNKPEEGEQMSLKFARKIERIASELSEKGLLKISEMLKPLAMQFRREWLGPQSIGFFEDLSNAGVQAPDGVSILDAYQSGVAEGSQMSQMTSLDAPVCDLVLCLARKHGLMGMARQAAYEKGHEGDPQYEIPGKKTYTFPVNALAVVLTDEDSEELWLVPIKNKPVTIFFNDDDGPTDIGIRDIKSSIAIPTNIDQLVQAAIKQHGNKARGKMYLLVVPEGDLDYREGRAVEEFKPGESVQAWVRQEADEVIDKLLSDQRNWKDFEPEYEP